MDNTKHGINPDRRLIGKLFPGYVFTYAISSLAGSISSLVDSLAVSNFLGETPTAAIGMTGIYYSVLTMLGGFFHLGTQILCSRALSRGDKEQSNKWFSLAVETSLVITAILAVSLITFTEQIAVILGVPHENAELISQIKAFNMGFFPNIPLSILITILTMAANLSGNRKLVTSSVSLTVVVDSLLDIIAAKVLGWGLFGIALATTFANLITMLYLLVGMRKKGALFHFYPVPVSLPEVRQIMHHGQSNVIYKILVIIRTILLNSLTIRAGGTIGMGTLAVLNTLSHLLTILGTGTANTVSLMSSVFYSEKDAPSLRQVCKYACLYSLGGGSLITALTIALAVPLASCFAPDPGPFRDCLITALRIFAFSVPLTALAECQFKYAQGVGKVKYARRFVIAAQIVTTAAMYLSEIWLGLNGLWFSFSLGILLGIIASVPIVYFGEEKTGPRFIDNMLLIGDDFVYLDQNSIDMYLEDNLDISRVSEMVVRYCEERGTDRRRAYFSALCLEELAALTLKHCASSAVHALCHIRLYFEGEDVILRIRDNSSVFDLTDSVYRAKESDDPFANVGVRLAYSIAKDVKYIRLMNTNTLIITI